MNDESFLPDTAISLNPPVGNPGDIRPDVGWITNSNKNRTITLDIGPNLDFGAIIRLVQHKNVKSYTVFTSHPSAKTQIEESTPGQTVSIQQHNGQTTVQIELSPIHPTQDMVVSISAKFCKHPISTTAAPATSATASTLPTTRPPTASTAMATTELVPSPTTPRQWVCALSESMNDESFLPDTAISLNPPVGNPGDIRPDVGWITNSNKNRTITLDIGPNLDFGAIIRLVQHKNVKSYTVFTSHPSAKTQIEESTPGQTVSIQQHNGQTTVQIELSPIHPTQDMVVSISAKFCKHPISTTAAPATSATASTLPTTRPPTASTAMATTELVPSPTTPLQWLCALSESMNDESFLPDTAISLNPPVGNPGDIRPDVGWITNSNKNRTITLDIGPNLDFGAIIRLVQHKNVKSYTVFTSHPSAKTQIEESTPGQTVSIQQHNGQTTVQIELSPIHPTQDMVVSISAKFCKHPISTTAAPATSATASTLPTTRPPTASTAMATTELVPSPTTPRQWSCALSETMNDESFLPDTAISLNPPVGNPGDIRPDVGWITNSNKNRTITLVIGPNLDFGAIIRLVEHDNVKSYTVSILHPSAKTQIQESSPDRPVAIPQHNSQTMLQIELSPTDPTRDMLVTLSAKLCKHPISTTTAPVTSATASSLPTTHPPTASTAMATTELVPSPTTPRQWSCALSETMNDESFLPDTAISLNPPVGNPGDIRPDVGWITNSNKNRTITLDIGPNLNFGAIIRLVEHDNVKSYTVFILHPSAKTQIQESSPDRPVSIPQDYGQTTVQIVLSPDDPTQDMLVTLSAKLCKHPISTTTAPVTSATAPTLPTTRPRFCNISEAMDDESFLPDTAISLNPPVGNPGDIRPDFGWLTNSNSKRIITLDIGPSLDDGGTIRLIRHDNVKSFTVFISRPSAKMQIETSSPDRTIHITQHNGQTTVEIEILPTDPTKDMLVTLSAKLCKHPISTTMAPVTSAPTSTLPTTTPRFCNISEAMDDESFLPDTAISLNPPVGNPGDIRPDFGWITNSNSKRIITLDIGPSLDDGGTIRLIRHDNVKSFTVFISRPSAKMQIETSSPDRTIHITQHNGQTTVEIEILPTDPTKDMLVTLSAKLCKHPISTTMAPVTSAPTSTLPTTTPRFCNISEAMDDESFLPDTAISLNPPVGNPGDIRPDFGWLTNSNSKRIITLDIGPSLDDGGTIRLIRHDNVKSFTVFISRPSAKMQIETSSPDRTIHITQHNGQTTVEIEILPTDPTKDMLTLSQRQWHQSHQHLHQLYQQLFHLTFSLDSSVQIFVNAYFFSELLTLDYVGASFTYGCSRFCNISEAMDDESFLPDTAISLNPPVGNPGDIRPDFGWLTNSNSKRIITLDVGPSLDDGATIRLIRHDNVKSITVFISRPSAKMQIETSSPDRTIHITQHNGQTTVEIEILPTDPTKDMLVTLSAKLCKHPISTTMAPVTSAPTSTLPTTTPRFCNISEAMDDESFLPDTAISLNPPVGNPGDIRPDFGWLTNSNSKRIITLDIGPSLDDGGTIRLIRHDNVKSFTVFISRPSAKMQIETSSPDRTIHITQHNGQTTVEIELLPTDPTKDMLVSLSAKLCKHPISTTMAPVTSAPTSTLPTTTPRFCNISEAMDDESFLPDTAISLNPPVGNPGDIRPDFGWLTNSNSKRIITLDIGPSLDDGGTIRLIRHDNVKSFTVFISRPSAKMQIETSSPDRTIHITQHNGQTTVEIELLPTDPTKDMLVTLSAKLCKHPISTTMAPVTSAPTSTLPTTTPPPNFSHLTTSERRSRTDVHGSVIYQKRWMMNLFLPDTAISLNPPVGNPGDIRPDFGWLTNSNSKRIITLDIGPSLDDGGTIRLIRHDNVKSFTVFISRPSAKMQIETSSPDRTIHITQHNGQTTVEIELLPTDPTKDMLVTLSAKLCKHPISTTMAPVTSAPTSTLPTTTPRFCNISEAMDDESFLPDTAISLNPPVGNPGDIRPDFGWLTNSNSKRIITLDIGPSLDDGGTIRLIRHDNVKSFTVFISRPSAKMQIETSSPDRTIHITQHNGQTTVEIELLPTDPTKDMLVSLSAKLCKHPISTTMAPVTSAPTSTLPTTTPRFCNISEAMDDESFLPDTAISLNPPVGNPGDIRPDFGWLTNSNSKRIITLDIGPSLDDGGTIRLIRHDNVKSFTVFISRPSAKMQIETSSPDRTIHITQHNGQTTVEIELLPTDPTKDMLVTLSAKLCKHPISTTMAPVTSAPTSTLPTTTPRFCNISEAMDDESFLPDTAISLNPPVGNPGDIRPDFGWLTNSNSKRIITLDIGPSLDDGGTIRLIRHDNVKSFTVFISRPSAKMQIETSSPDRTIHITQHNGQTTVEIELLPTDPTKDMLVTLSAKLCKHPISTTMAPVTSAPTSTLPTTTPRFCNISEAMDDESFLPDTAISLNPPVGNPGDIRPDLDG
ncbi:mucin-3A-like [Octopus sinensis]|uniref:Mucin-3A-like n=1 Tax=Octopus sinensis TaxID=2607531 RepID=A0A7E6ENS1_9MOLL|nr:mucin-3A-like [Octopus sinensis]